MLVVEAEVAATLAVLVVLAERGAVALVLRKMQAVQLRALLILAVVVEVDEMPTAVQAVLES
jgi:hypothetical protein